MQTHLATAFRITTHLSFVTTATPNQSMKAIAPLQSNFSVFATTPWISSKRYKKEYLLRKYGIRWKDPSEMNPEIAFD